MAHEPLKEIKAKIAADAREMRPTQFAKALAKARREWGRRGSIASMIAFEAFEEEDARRREAAQ